MAVDSCLEEDQSGSVRAIVKENTSEDDNSLEHDQSNSENQPNSLDEESMIDEESIERTCADIFICPMCGKESKEGMFQHRLGFEIIFNASFIFGDAPI